MPVDGVRRTPGRPAPPVPPSAEDRETTSLARAGSAPPGKGQRRAGRPRQHDSSGTRQMLLDVALDAFAEHGLDGVAVRDLARRSQVSATTLFHHFATKEDLYAAAYEHAVGLAYAHYRQAVAGSTSLVDELRRILHAADVLLTERPAIALLAVRTQIDQQRPRPHLAGRPATAGSFREELVQRAIERGELEATDAIHVQRLLDVVLWGISVIGYDDGEVRRQAIEAIEAFISQAFPIERRQVP